MNIHFASGNPRNIFLLTYRLHCSGIIASITSSFQSIHINITVTTIITMEAAHAQGRDLAALRRDRKHRARRAQKAKQQAKKCKLRPPSPVSVHTSSRPWLPTTTLRRGFDICKQHSKPSKMDEPCLSLSILQTASALVAGCTPSSYVLTVAASTKRRASS